MITERIQLDKLPHRGMNSYLCEINGRDVYIPFKSVNYLHNIEFYMDVDVVFLTQIGLIPNTDLEFLESYDKTPLELFNPFIKKKINKSSIGNGKYKMPSIKEKKYSEYKSIDKCCYCECILTNQNKTREHVIPKRVGGKIILPCCSDCNTEKGGLMIASYIHILNMKLLDETGHSLRILQIKISNANKIAIQLEKGELK